MKLQAAYNRTALLVSLTMLLLGSTADYFILRYVLIRQIDESLKVEQVEILDFVKKNNTLPPESRYMDQQIFFYEASNPVEQRFFSLRDSADEEHPLIRRLEFPINLDNKFIRAVVTKSQEETEDLILLLVGCTALLILLLLATFFLLYRVFLKKMWQPFYATLEGMKEFELSGQSKVVTQQSRIDEFKDLNHALESMTKKIEDDYYALKIFTENASHEMQTPLAVITSKIDLLIQESRNEEDLEHVRSLYQSVNMLSKLNRSLLLLARIGNKQFSVKEPIDLAAACSEKILDFQEILQSKSIQLETEISPSTVYENHELVDILLNNVFMNAIRHTSNGGLILIQVNAFELLVSNTATDNKALDQSMVFNRFVKGENSPGLGLGLAIVKQICDSIGASVNYHLEKGMHHFKIIFKGHAKGSN